MKTGFALLFGLFLVVTILLIPGVSGADTISQWASSVIDYSSEYPGWEANKALGEPDTSAYGDIMTAWAPLPENGSKEYITLGFTTPVYATGALIRETFGNGFVYRIDVVDALGVLHKVWEGIDSSLPYSPVDFTVSWMPTSYLVKGIKIYNDTDHDFYAWEEIDAVQLFGSTTAVVPLPPSLFLLAPGLVGLAAVRRRFKK
jgi:hypothetical protein